MACAKSSHVFNESEANNAVVGAIVVYTNGVSFHAFQANSTKVLSSHSVELSNIATSRVGWAEQDPVTLLEAVRVCVDKTVIVGKVMGVPVVTVGVSNHRGSVVAWNRKTGAAMSNLILWSDNRTAAKVEKYSLAYGKYRFQATCGLPFSPYFAAFTIQWLIENDDSIEEAYKNGDCYFGTVDTWLLWNLTGGVKNGVFATDTTNAANTFLMNINTLQWDTKLLKFFGITYKCLPTIKSSSEVYGHFDDGPLKDTPISAVLGNRQAALIGHRCFRRGSAKASLDADGSVLYVTGENKVFSDNGLTTTIAYHLDTRPMYALEGQIASVGRSIDWTKRHFKVEESLLMKKDKHQMYYIPAFNGLYAPHWRPMSRCALVGMNKKTYQESILSAAIESVSFQSQDVLEAMRLDLKLPLDRLKVDGYLTKNKTIMQSLSDITNTRVEVATIDNMTELGTAMTAGYVAEINVWNALCMPEDNGKLFAPKMTVDKRKAKINGWKKALRCSFDWVGFQKQTNYFWTVAPIVAGISLLGMYFVLKKQ